MSDNVVEVAFPTADPFPPQTGDPFLDTLEVEIVRGVVEMVHAAVPIGFTAGLARARTSYLGLHPELVGDGPIPSGGRFIASVLIRIRELPEREQAKLRHPARDRAAIQLIMEGRNG